MDALRGRLGFDQFSGYACVSRWLVFFTTRSALAFSLTSSPAETLDYYSVPFFGYLANRFVDDE